MLDKLSAAQLVKVFNAVTDREKPVRKFESHARALALTIAELDRMNVTAPVAMARAGLAVPVNVPLAALKKAVADGVERHGAVVEVRAAAFVPTAIDAVSGNIVELRSLHGPIRTVEGDPEKAAAKIAKDSVKELRQARLEREAAKVAKRARTRLGHLAAPAPANSTGPFLGIVGLKRPSEAPATPAPASKPVSLAGAAQGLTPEQDRLLMALIDCKALTDKPLKERAGVWVKYKAIHDSNTPHNLAKGQLPGLTGALRRRGMIELRGNSANGEVCVTTTGLEAPPWK